MSKARKTAIILMGISIGFTVLYEILYLSNYYRTVLLSGLFRSTDAFHSWVTMIVSLVMALILFMNVQMLFIVFTAVFHKKSLFKGFGLATILCALAHYTYQLISSGVSIWQFSSHSAGVTALISPVITVVCDISLLVLCVFGLIAVIKRKKLTVIFMTFAGVGILFPTAKFLFMVRYLIMGDVLDTLLQLSWTVSELTFFCAFAALALESATGTQTTSATVS